MALNVDLAPHKRIIIANVSVRNGDRRARLTFETEAKFLREKDMLPASEASTAAVREDAAGQELAETLARGQREREVPSTMYLL